MTGTTSIDHACSMFDQTFGFSNEWTELALKKPPRGADQADRLLVRHLTQRY